MAPAEIFFSNGPVKIDKGEYVIIDPSYVLSGSDWERFSIELLMMPKITGLLACHFGKHSFTVWSTHAGNGDWPVYNKDGKEIGCVDVSSGILAILPKMMTYRKAKKQDIGRKGIKIKILKRVAPVELVEMGDVKIGTYKIITSGETDDEASSSSDSYSTDSYSTDSDSGSYSTDSYSTDSYSTDSYSTDSTDSSDSDSSSD